MYHLLLVRYGEISLKGRNRKMFEDILLGNIRTALQGILVHDIHKTFGRLYIETDHWQQAAERLQRVFGIVSLSPVLKAELHTEAIKAAAVKVMADASAKTFKVETRRPNKAFPLTSPELSRTLGAHVLQSLPGLSVDVHKPDVILNVEVRQEGAFLYSRTIPGLGGLPVGASGKGFLLLSGGIDSPVAGFLALKRGVAVEGLHFHSYPFTTERSKEKVIELGRILGQYTGRGQFPLWICHFTEIQKAIQGVPFPSLRITIMRRFMLRIAAQLAQSHKAYALITGESLGQVASQTMESIFTINAVTNMPVYRPLIGLDKEEIVEIARRIGTYETSILPYEDCCTVFVPRNPATRPTVDQALEAESYLDVEGLVAEAIAKTEYLDV
ncbi:MAG: tRNA 4-thiouridine(8) synthase ThiI [Firmicutes bacterium]|nr:tRNA 4-thiouridine(8) synthase ThiI [Bacillota bacterium]